MSSPLALKNSTTAFPPGFQLFPQSKRLRKKAEFQRVYEEGTKLTGSLFLLFCRRSPTTEAVRVGLAVPRSLGKAVTRNRVKRRLREAVRHHWKDLTAGLEIVIHARRNIVSAAWPTLETEVVRKFREAVRLTNADHHTAKPPRSS